MNIAPSDIKDLRLGRRLCINCGLVQLEDRAAKAVCFSAAVIHVVGVLRLESTPVYFIQGNILPKQERQGDVFRKIPCACLLYTSRCV